MEFIIRIIIIAGLSYAAELLLPWWSVVIVAFIIGFIWKSSSANAFLSGILGVGLLWFGAALFFSTSINSPLPTHVAALFNLGSSILLAAATGLVGGIAGGMASLSGNYLNKLIYKQEDRFRY